MARRTGRKIVAVTIALAVAAAGLFVYQLVRSAGIPRSREAVRSDNAEEDGRGSPTSLPVPNKSIAALPFDDLRGGPRFEALVQKIVGGK